MITEKQYAKAAAELIEVMGLVPDPKKPKVLFDLESMKSSEIEALVRDAITQIEAGDIFSTQTQTIINELTNPTSENTKQEVAALAVEDLLDDIMQAEKLSQLKEIAKQNAEFKAIRGTLSSFKSVDDLREKMIEVLAEPVEEVIEEKLDEEIEDETDETPVEEEEVEVIAVTKKKEEPIKEVEKKQRKTGPKHINQQGAGGYTRIDSICETLKNAKPKTLKAWVQSADDLYVKNGGRTSLRESGVCTRYIANAMSHFGVDTPK